MQLRGRSQKPSSFSVSKQRDAGSPSDPRRSASVVPIDAGRPTRRRRRTPVAFGAPVCRWPASARPRPSPCRPAPAPRQTPTRPVRAAHFARTLISIDAAAPPAGTATCLVKYVTWKLMSDRRVLVEEAVDVRVVQRLDAHDVEAGRERRRSTKSPCGVSEKPLTIVARGRIERRDMRAEHTGAVQRDPAGNRAELLLSRALP